MHKQLLRYVMVGIGSNAILYLAYLLLTGLGLGHKTAMTLLYMVGIFQTFLLNRSWTFAHQGHVRSAFIRYIIIYLLGYLVNFSGLYVFVDVIGFSHQLIQGVMVILVAVLLFVLQKLWVFDKHNERLGYTSKQEIP
ncbi:MAG: GtrA family protein [Desulfobulbaceae bacterium]|nr:MAG: GtrA family protein [Desulfobulbaceae bacterium]